MEEYFLNNPPKITDEFLTTFGYKNVVEAMERSIEDEKFLLCIALYTFLENEERINITAPIVHFSMITTGNRYNKVSEFVKYLYDNIEEKKLSELLVGLISVKEKENKDLNVKVYEALNLKTKEDMEKKYSKNMIEITKKLIEDPKKAYSLKMISEITTNIEHNKLVDFIDYLGKVMEKEDQENFKKILDII